MTSRLLVVTADTFNFPTDQTAVREVDLFWHLARGTDTLFTPEPAHCREWLLELIARAASAGVDVLYVGDTEGDFANTDFTSGYGVSVESCFRYVMSPAKPQHPAAPGTRFRERVRTYNSFNTDPAGPAPHSVVVLDRMVAGPIGRRYFRRHDRVSSGSLTLIEPSPWGGLALADYDQACRALRLQPPAPQPEVNEAGKYDQNNSDLF